MFVEINRFMLRKIRIALAMVFWVGITLLLLDITGVLHLWLGWMAKIQFLPAVLALNAAVIVGLVLLTLLLGRVYCSVICPLGVFQDGVAHMGVVTRAIRYSRKHNLRSMKGYRPYRYKKENKWLRYGVLAVFVIALVAGLNALAVLVAPYSAYGRIVQNLGQPVVQWVNNLLAAWAEKHGSYAFYPREVWLKSLPTLIVAVVTLVLVVILAWTGGRTWCNTICPVGTVLGFLSRFSAFRPVIDTEKCKSCKRCEHECKASCIDIEKKKIDYSRCVDCFNCIDTCQFGALKYRFAWGKKTTARTDAGRRAFLLGAGLVAGSAIAKAQRKKVDGGLTPLQDKVAPERKTPITPPGSLSVKHFYQHCTACQLCVASCPNNVLRPSDRLEHLMQPELSYEKGYCRPECVRCSQVCPAGAIRAISKEEKTQYHIGTAQINRELCVAETGTACGNCARHCPVGAIQMVEDAERGVRVPAVNEALCIGCGACENLCPVRPVSAITVNGRHDHLNA